VTLARIADDARRTADDLTGRLIAGALDDASYAIKSDALRVAGLVAGGDRRLSRFGGGKSKGRVRMGVNYTVADTRSVILLKPAALWALTTSGARAHMIGAGRRTRAGRATKGRRGRVVVAFPVAVAAPGRGKATRVRVGPVRHPGARGRGSLIAVYRNVDKHLADTFGDALRESFQTWGGR